MSRLVPLGLGVIGVIGMVAAMGCDSGAAGSAPDASSDGGGMDVGNGTAEDWAPAHSFSCDGCLGVRMAAWLEGDVVVYGNTAMDIVFELTTLGPASPISDEVAYGARIAADGQVVWAKQLSEGVPGNWSIAALATGPEHVVYAVLSRYAEPAITLKKFGADGTTLWTRVYGFNGSSISGMAVDVDGTILVTGYLTGPIDFGDGPFTVTTSGGTASHGNPFVARLDSEGRHVWSRSIAVANNQAGQNVAISPSGRIAITGVGQSTTTGTRNPWLVALFEANGTAVWNRTFPGRIGNTVYVAFAGDDIVVGGGFEEFLELGGETIASVGSEDIFVARFAPTGQLLWRRAFGSDYHDGLGGLAVDQQGSIVLSGFSWALFKALTLGGPYLGAVPSANPVAFVGKLDPSGNHLRTSVFEPTDMGPSASPPACAVDAQGAIHVAGQADGDRRPAIYVGTLAP